MTLNEIDLEIQSIDAKIDHLKGIMPRRLDNWTLTDLNLMDALNKAKRILETLWIQQLMEINKVVNKTEPVKHTGSAIQ